MDKVRATKIHTNRTLNQNKRDLEIIKYDAENNGRQIIRGMAQEEYELLKSIIEDKEK